MTEAKLKKADPGIASAIQALRRAGGGGEAAGGKGSQGPEPARTSPAHNPAIVYLLEVIVTVLQIILRFLK